MIREIIYDCDVTLEKIEYVYQIQKERRPDSVFTIYLPLTVLIRYYLSHKFDLGKRVFWNGYLWGDHIKYNQKVTIVTDQETK